MATVNMLFNPEPAYDRHQGTIILPRIALVSVNAGQGLYEDGATGKVGVADATGAGQINNFAGIALNSAGPNQGISMLTHGIIAGFDVSALQPGALIYLDVTGNLATVANATKTVLAGQVVPSARVLSSGLIWNLIWIFRKVTD